MPAPPDLHYVKGDHVQIRSTGDGAILINLATGEIFELNSVGADIWALLFDQGYSLEAVTEALVTRYGIDVGKCQADMDALIASLCSASLIRQRPA